MYCSYDLALQSIAVLGNRRCGSSIYCAVKACRFSHWKYIPAPGPHSAMLWMLKKTIEAVLAVLCRLVEPDGCGISLHWN